MVKLAPFGGKNKEDTPVSASDKGLQAARLVEDSDVEGALEYYDTQIEDEQDSNEKKLLLIMKSRDARGAGMSEVSLSAAKQADEIGSDGMTMRNLADAYVAVDDKEQALVYYRKLLEMYPENDEVTRRGPSLSEIIKDLEK